MQERRFAIANRLGLHARPAALFVQLANRFQCQIKVAKALSAQETSANDLREADGKSIMGLLMLAAQPGSELRITADGVDEGEAMAALAALIERQFDED